MNKSRTAEIPERSDKSFTAGRLLRPSAVAAFTLIELLLVISIVALMAGLFFPVFQSVQQKADSVACQNNLRQIGIAVQFAAQDNNNVYPHIEPAPPPYEKPVYPEDVQAKSLLDTLSKYGVTSKTLQCRADVRGLSGDDAATYAKTPDLYCSYLWIPLVDDEPANSVHIYTRWGGTFNPKPSKLRLITDKNSVHRQRQNMLYADGHVVGF